MNPLNHPHLILKPRCPFRTSFNVEKVAHFGWLTDALAACKYACKNVWIFSFVKTFKPYYWNLFILAVISMAFVVGGARRLVDFLVDCA